MTSLGALLGIVAIVTLPAATSAPSRNLHVKMCHGGFADIPLKRDDTLPRDKGCAFGCHAPLCQERKRRSG